LVGHPARDRERQRALVLVPPDTDRNAVSSGDRISRDLEGRFRLLGPQELAPELRVRLERHDRSTESVPLSDVLEPESQLIRHRREVLPAVPKDVHRSDHLEDAERPPPVVKGEEPAPPLPIRHAVR